MIGVVADDITGANDIGIMFAKRGYLVYVYPYDAFEAHSADKLPDVLILNTESRFDDPKVAYQKVFKATELLRGLNCTHFYKKTCSAFRGNIGAELDAMLDALNESFGIIVAAFPKNGRITKSGIHYVHGIPLEHSEFRNDPIHPMLKSNIVDILQDQTAKSVALVDYGQVHKGAEALKKIVENMKAKYNYLVFDALSQQDLKIIAEAMKDEMIFGGSSALAEELPAFWTSERANITQVRIPNKKNIGILCTAGSLMPQTARQIKYLCASGAAFFELNTLKLFEPDQRYDETQRLISAIASRLIAGQDVVLCSPNDADMVARTKTMGFAKGLSAIETARVVSGAMADVTAGVVERSGQNRLLIAGGDTSAAVCSKLGIKGLMICDEIQPGLPSCISISPKPMLLILKSGSFGSDDFFAKAVQYLKMR